jgi:putative N6-adenine-specific DNA methylase
LNRAETHFFFASCPRGLEAVLVNELTSLNASHLLAVDGGVHFKGPLELCYAANLHSRVASRVLWRVARAAYRNETDIYEQCHRLPWPTWFDCQRTLRVNVSAIKASVKSLDFITLRIKDAVCDVFRSHGGQRPSIDTHNPDIRVHAFLTATELTVYIDTSGDPLFKRGYRREAGEAPLKENLAAGMIYLSGWSPGRVFLDPFCGSGTLLCEAALMSAHQAPGLHRSFAFEKLHSFDPSAWSQQKKMATDQQTTIDPDTLLGSDLRGDAISMARANLDSLGFVDAVSLKQANFFEFPPPASSGILVANPPYGVRMEDRESLASFYPKLGDTLKKRFSGWTAYILSSDPQLAKGIGLAASKRTPLFNGALECRLFEYKMIAGTMRRIKADKTSNPTTPAPNTNNPT